MELTEEAQARFWSRVTLPDADGCMLWTAFTYPGGYGAFSSAGKNVMVHRASLWLAEGPPPEGKTDAAHSCRNRHCVAPAHLRWASAQENQRDRRRDGTVSRGESNGQAKLSVDQVIAIRRRYAAGGLSHGDLASAFGVSKTAIRAVITRKKWAHVGNGSTS